MRGRVARNVFALGSAGLVVLGIAGCNQSKPEEGGTAQANLKIRPRPGAYWYPIRPDPKVGVWTDDYASIMRVFLPLRPDRSAD